MENRSSSLTVPLNLHEINRFLGTYDISYDSITPPNDSLAAHSVVQSIINCNERCLFDRLHRVSSHFGYACSQESLRLQPFPHLQYTSSTSSYALPFWDSSQAKMSFLPVLFSKVSAISCNLVIMVEGERTWGTSCDDDITLSLALESEEALGGCVLTWMRLEGGRRVGLLRIDGWKRNIAPSQEQWEQFTTLYHKARLELILSECKVSVMIVDVGGSGEDNAWGVGTHAGLILTADTVLQQIESMNTGETEGKESSEEVADTADAPAVSNASSDLPAPPIDINASNSIIEQVHQDSKNALSEYQDYLTQQQSLASRRLQERLQRRRMQNSSILPPSPVDATWLPPLPPTDTSVSNRIIVGGLSEANNVNVPRAMYEVASCCKQLCISLDQYAFVDKISRELIRDRKQSSD